jgi:hypothetical protein
MLVRQVRRKLFDIRLLATTERFAIWKITPDGQVRRTVLSRDRRDTGSLVLPVNRVRGPLASLRRARRNVSMKKTAAPQTLVNAIGTITDDVTSRGRNVHGDA